MKKYDYLAVETQDVINYLNENYSKSDIQDALSSEENRQLFQEELNEKLWAEDSVTGNASGSYTFNTWDAEENICHNLDLLQEALSEFGYEKKFPLDKGAEWADATIRCYLLNQAISDALDKIPL